jgi:exodeoxyribonuclease V beta subunit
LAKYHTMVGIGADDANKVECLQQWLEQCLGAAMPPIARTDTAYADTDASASPTNQGVFTLSQLSPQQTLREAEFYFPLAHAKQSTLAQILSRHRGGLPTALPSHPVLQGMMHGFIDLIFEHEGKFFVADYKSNYLGDGLDHYHYQAMLEANQNHYYDLQYLIYSLALHRYLGQKMPNYDAVQHFGGVYYLYLRGMIPNSTSGVFATAISIEELNELDQLFAGATP